jgi:hypothetical protein
MGRNAPHTTALRALLKGNKQLPGTVRALARQAGVPHTTLVRIAAGDLGASSLVAERVAAALDAWSRSCSAGAEKLRQSIRRTRPLTD